MVTTAIGDCDWRLQPVKIGNDSQERSIVGQWSLWWIWLSSFRVGKKLENTVHNGTFKRERNSQTIIEGNITKNCVKIFETFRFSLVACSHATPMNLTAICVSTVSCIKRKYSCQNRLATIHIRQKKWTKMRDENSVS